MIIEQSKSIITLEKSWRWTLNHIPLKKILALKKILQTFESKNMMVSKLQFF